MSFTVENLEEKNMVKLVILCLGLDESLEGEEGDTGNAYASGDKQGLMLPPSQQRLLEIVAEMGVPFIVCMIRRMNC